jgi:phthiodiolone/phenolphthiodiolone dimycocerosates ketoreductase
VAGVRVGVIENIVNSRLGPDPLVRVGYLTAAACRVDSFWVPDHLNALFPRSICTPKYVGGARLTPKPDAYLEPWTMLGYIAAHNRIGRLRLGVCVTDTGRRNPAVSAQAAATLHLLTRGRAILGIGTGEREVFTRSGDARIAFAVKGSSASINGRAERIHCSGGRCMASSSTSCSPAGVE